MPVSRKSALSESKNIFVKRARENNLQNISVSFPRGENDWGDRSEWVREIIPYF